LLAEAVVMPLISVSRAAATRTVIACEGRTRRTSSQSVTPGFELQERVELQLKCGDIKTSMDS